MEQRVRFELTVLRICNPLHLTTLPPLHKIGRNGRIRTYDLLLPKQAHYLAVLHSEINLELYVVYMELL